MVDSTAAFVFNSTSYTCLAGAESQSVGADFPPLQASINF
jgi:hypothetical protein